MATGGGDECEDLLGALDEVNKLSFDEFNLTHILLLQDAPCHGDNYNGGAGDNHPN
jgi:hypothetical protein